MSGELDINTVAQYIFVLTVLIVLHLLFLLCCCPTYIVIPSSMISQLLESGASAQAGNGFLTITLIYYLGVF